MFGHCRLSAIASVRHQAGTTLPPHGARAGSSRFVRIETPRADAAVINNLRAAYLHVLADALTSVLAIAALLGGSLYGWLWLDPAMGIVGAFVIARWSWGLIRDAGGVLVDYIPSTEDLPDEIREAIETDVDHTTDLHVWQLGPGHHGAIVSLVSTHPRPPSHYRAKLAHIHDLSHVTVEVEPQELVHDLPAKGSSGAERGL